MTARAVLRADAVLDLVLGWLLLSGTWDALYETLDLPKANPALLAQIGGALLWAFAYLLWVAPADAALARRVAAAAAIANGLAVAVIAAWLLFGPDVVGTLGTTLLAIVALVLAAFAFAEARIARG